MPDGDPEIVPDFEYLNSCHLAVEQQGTLLPDKAPGSDGVCDRLDLGLVGADVITVNCASEREEDVENGPLLFLAHRRDARRRHVYLKGPSVRVLICPAVRAARRGTGAPGSRCFGRQPRDGESRQHSSLLVRTIEWVGIHV